jgi:hypothetical protein
MLVTWLLLWWLRSLPGVAAAAAAAAVVGAKMMCGCGNLNSPRQRLLRFSYLLLRHLLLLPLLLLLFLLLGWAAAVAGAREVAWLWCHPAQLLGPAICG